MEEMKTDFKYDERRREMTFTTLNNEDKAGIQRTFVEVFNEKAIRDFWAGCKKQKSQINDNVQRGEKFVQDSNDQIKRMVQDLAKQKIVVTEELTPALAGLKDQLKALQDWDQIYGKPVEKTKVTAKNIEQSKKELKVLNARMEKIKSLAKNLNLS